MMYGKKFLEFHRENPHVWSLFEKYSLEAIKAGREKLGIALIAERIRWYISVETTGEDFKINNNYKADYARMFMRAHPEYEGFFSLRQRKIELVDEAEDLV